MKELADTKLGQHKSNHGHITSGGICPAALLPLLHLRETGEEAGERAQTDRFVLGLEGSAAAPAPLSEGGIGGPELLPPPSPAAGGNYGGFSMFLRGEEDGGGNKMMGARGKARVRVRPEEVAEAANLAASGQPFDVLYYPRASTPEFCVRAAAVRAAMRTQWCPGMRFKMAFETEDSSRISWFMGTVSAVQVTWDEPDLLQNVKRVSPWLVELVSNMPAIHLAPFSPPRKKLCVPFYPDLPADGQFPAPMFHGNPLGRGGGVVCHRTGFTRPRAYRGGQPPRIAAGLIIGHPAARDDISCMLTIGSHQNNNNNKSDVKKASPQLMLFGKPILTEQQITLDQILTYLANFAGEFCSDFTKTARRLTILTDTSGDSSVAS
ncbi:Auxin response factor 18 [Triticum urartu]|uniref:Auxin response factor 18 n=1 Tax=Triticum urartu TaxID=4572 RepID=M7ZJF3_TRIUA|nr:Auxin response factor 18 [Triticum urartu]